MLLAVSLFVGQHAREAMAAAVIENQTGTWEAAGMGSYFARAWDEILPEDLLARVTEEALKFQAYEAQERVRKTGGGGYMHGKDRTFWRPLYT